MDILTLKSDRYVEAYIAGTMTDEDKREFEVLLKHDKDLQMKVALHREMIVAIRERRMRQLVKQFEQEDYRRKRMRVIVNRTIQVISPIVIAACLVGLVVYLPQVNHIEYIKSDSSVFIAATEEVSSAYSNLRGCDDVAETLLVVSELIKGREYAEADQLLAEQLKLHASVTREEPQAWAEKEDMIYLQALCAIGQKQVYRSRALLAKVISMEGLHEKQATDLLNIIKHGK